MTEALKDVPKNSLRFVSAYPTEYDSSSAGASC